LLVTDQLLDATGGDARAVDESRAGGDRHAAQAVVTDTGQRAVGAGDLLAGQVQGGSAVVGLLQQVS
jgi:hypothetical protein